MLKKYLSLILALLIALQSMAVIADNYQIHQINNKHSEFQHLTSVNNNNPAQEHSIDCHCCHCPFFLTENTPYIPFYLTKQVWFESPLVYFSTPTYPNFRPPIL